MKKDVSAGTKSIVRKIYTDLAKSTKPTGDPGRPPNITRAKQSERAIEGTVHVANLSDVLSSEDSDWYDEDREGCASLIPPTGTPTYRLKRLPQGRQPWNVCVGRELRLLSTFHNGTVS
jgi:hypothetical protein